MSNIDRVYYFMGGVIIGKVVNIIPTIIITGLVYTIVDPMFTNVENVTGLIRNITIANGYPTGFL
jgi:hypothetical protein